MYAFESTLYPVLSSVTFLGIFWDFFAPVRPNFARLWGVGPNPIFFLNSPPAHPILCPNFVPNWSNRPSPLFSGVLALPAQEQSKAASYRSPPTQQPAGLNPPLPNVQDHRSSAIPQMYFPCFPCLRGSGCVIFQVYSPCQNLLIRHENQSATPRICLGQSSRQ